MPPAATSPFCAHARCTPGELPHHARRAPPPTSGGARRREAAQPPSYPNPRYARWHANRALFCVSRSELPLSLSRPCCATHHGRPRPPHGGREQEERMRQRRPPLRPSHPPACKTSVASPGNISDLSLRRQKRQLFGLIVVHPSSWWFTPSSPSAEAAGSCSASGATSGASRPGSAATRSRRTCEEGGGGPP